MIQETRSLDVNLESGRTDMEPGPEYLKPTYILDSDREPVIEYARRCAGPSQDHREQAVNLFHAVRDDIRYDPYLPFDRPEYYRASHVLEIRRGFCVNKAGLLCAVARVVGIPSRIGFATVRNHLATRQMIEYLGSDIVAYHGYAELYLEGRWVRATPTFHKELCARHNVRPLDFDGQHDAIFQSYNDGGEKFMEYLEYHGTHADIPVDLVLETWNRVYGPERVATWKREAGKGRRDFSREDVYNG